MEQALYRKWRPQTWDEVYGQDHVVQTLRNAVKGGRLGHAYLFAGPRGTGKTTAARLLAKAANCTAEDLAERPCNQCANCLAVNDGRFLDLVEIDAASNTSVDDVRSLRDKINFAPNVGRSKVYIVDEVHMLSTAAFNALLKTLEEPPPHAIFVLATTEVHKIPATVLSRCQRHEFRRLPQAVIADYLKLQVEQSDMQVDPQAIELIARQATGSFRDAISMLDQLTSTGGRVDLAQVREVLGTAASEAVRGIVGAWRDGDRLSGIERINQALDSGADPRQLARQIVEYLRRLMLTQMGVDQLVDALPEERAELAATAARVSLPQVLAVMRGFSAAALERGSAGLPSLPLELAFLEALGAAPASMAPSSSASSNPPPAAPSAGPSNRPPSAPPAAAGSPPPAVAPSKAPASGAPREEKPGPADGGSAPISKPLSSGEAISFEQLLERWKLVKDAAGKRQPQAQGLLNSCDPLGLKDGVLRLAFPSDILVEKMEKEHSLAAVHAALLEVTGNALRVACIARSKGKAAGESTPRAAAPPEEDGVVATAVRDLGAKVVDVHPIEDEPGG